MANPWESDPIVQQGGAITATPLPRNPYDVQQDAEDNRRKQREIELAEERDRRAAEKAERDRIAWEAKYNPDGTPKAQVDPMKLAQFRALEEQINRVEELYTQGPGTTKGLAGIQDYLPTGTNSAFDSASAGLGEVGLAAFRVPGVGSQSDAELRQFVAANTPRAGDRDEAILEKLGNLRRRLDATKQALGIVAEEPSQGDDRPNAMTMIRTDGGQQGDLAAASRGSTTTAVPYPEAGQAEHDAIVARLISQGGGRLDPAAYVQARQQLDEKYGITSDPAALQAWAGQINQYLDGGGRTIPTGVQAAERPMTQTEIENNNAVNNPLAAGFVGFVDGATGIPTAFAPDQMDALSDAQFPSMTAGQVGGAIATTTGLGSLGRFGASKFAPQLLGGGGKGQFARGIATDAAYGSLYRGFTEGDFGKGAVEGAVGSAVGQPFGKLAGKVIGGVPVSEAVEAMGRRGIPMTTGQRLGGAWKAAEEKATSIPIVGDMINARHMDGRRAFNRGAFEIGAETIPGEVVETGFEGVGQLNDLKSAAYRSALDPATLDVAGSPTVREGVMNAQLTAQAIPEVGQGAADAIGYRVGSGLDANGTMSGRDFQEAYRGLARSGREAANGSYANEYSNAMRMAQDVLSQGLEQQNPGAFAGFQAANTANRRLNVLATAVDNAKNQEGQLFTPKQLANADAMSARQLTGRISSGSGNRPFAQYAADGVETLSNNTPDSGTAGRVAQMAGGAGILGAGGAGGYYLGGQSAEGAQTGATATGLATALALLGGTKGGQAALNKVLFDRPEVVENMVKQVRASNNPLLRRRSGLFGSAAVPMVMAAQ